MMVPRRRHFALVLVLVVVGWAASLVRGSTGAAVGPAAPTPSAQTASGIAAALGRVERAFNAGDVGLLCRPGALVDPAVVRVQDAQSGGCKSQAETLIGDKPRMRLSLRAVAIRGDLATATVQTARGTTTHVDLIRTGGRWLLSFSDRGDPVPGLAGVASA
jgi:hypothetical protein